MTHLSEKQYKKFVAKQKDVDVWRYGGEFDIAQQRAEKKCRKHCPSGSAYEHLVLGEALLNTLLGPYLEQDTPLDEGLENDFIFIPVDQSVRETVLAAAQPSVRSLEQAYLRAKEDYDRNDFTSEKGKMDMQQAHTWLAWLHLVCGRPDDALKLLGPFQFAEAENMSKDAEPYCKAMILAGLTVKALALHLTGDDIAAQQLTKRAVTFYSQHSDAPAPVIRKRHRYTHRREIPEDNQWLRWFEMSHHAHILLSAKLGLCEESVATGRVYIPGIKNTADTFRTQSKAAVLGVFIRLLLGFPPVCRPPRRLEGIPKLTRTTVPSHIRIEALKYMPIYEEMMTNVLTFPRGEDPKPYDANRHERVFECYEWYGYLSMYLAPEEPIGDAADRHYRLIEDLYRATKHSFNSLRALRYLIHTFTSLISFFGDNMPADEKTEAELIIDSYVFLWDKYFNKWLEQRSDQATVAGVVDPTHLSGTSAPPSSHGDQVQSNSAVEETAIYHYKQHVMEQVDSAKSFSGRDATTESNTDGNTQAVDGVTQSSRVVFGRVGGESLVDVVGALLAGTRIVFLNIEGQSEKLRKCVRWTEHAVKLLNDYGAECGEQLPNLQHMAYRWLGMSYGELAAEVCDSQQKREFQKKALEATKKAKTLNPNGWEVLYQRALQLAEAGEITMAILRVKESLQHNRAYAPSWNLLALLFSARKDFDQALRVCEIGVKECLSDFQDTPDVFAIPNGLANGRSHWSWDNVDPKDREELINLKLTHVALEVQKHGPKQGLDTLKKVLRLARKLFGGIDSPDPHVLRDSIDSQTASHATPELSVPPGITNGKASTRSRASSFTSKNSGVSQTLLSPSSTTVGSVYRFRAYDLFVCIWLTASALFRAMEKFPEALGAIQEAEKLADSMAQMDVMVRRLPSRVYHEATAGRISEEHKKLKGLLKPTSGRYKHRKSEEAKDTLPFYIPKWGPVSSTVRRVVADVAFEAAMVRQAEYDVMMRRPAKPKYAKYSTPTAKLEAERKLQSWKAKVASGGLRRTPSQSSCSSAQSALPGASGPNDGGRTNRPQTPVANEAGSIRSNREESVSTKATPVPPVQVQINGMAVKDSEVRNSSEGGVNWAIAPNGMDKNMEREALTLESLIDTFDRVTHIDDDHLGARIHLGILYYKKGDIDIAEHHLERACKSSKARGGGGGKSGQGSWYGGATARWGWDGWRWFGRCLVKRERTEVAREALGFAVKMERVSPIRGLECLRRMVNSDLSPAREK